MLYTNPCYHTFLSLNDQKKKVTKKLWEKEKILSDKYFLLLPQYFTSFEEAFPLFETNLHC